jgi:hypothetical protein
MGELAFPPQRNDAPDLAVAADSEETVEEDALPPIKYIAINQELIDDPPHGLQYFEAQNDRYIRKLAERRKSLPRGCIASDGETEIWRAGSAIPREPGWIIEPATPYMPLAQSVGPLNYQKLFRTEDGSEVRNGQRFYGFSSPASVLAPIERLKADVTGESWRDGDLALANCDLRWMAGTRGPVRSGFQDSVHPREAFGEFHPLAADGAWQPPLEGTGPKEYVLPLKPPGVFHPDHPPAGKFDSLRPDGVDAPPLAVLEEYHDPVAFGRIEGKAPKRKQRFSAVFPTSKVQLGATDSMTVKQRSPTFVSASGCD